MEIAKSLVPWSISILSLLFVILTYIRNGRKDSDDNRLREETKFDGIKESLLKVNMKLDQVCTTTNETRSDVKSMGKDLQGIDNRVSVVERDLKTAFAMIDEIKKGRTV